MIGRARIERESEGLEDHAGLGAVVCHSVEEMLIRRWDDCFT